MPDERNVLPDRVTAIATASIRKIEADLQWSIDAGKVLEEKVKQAYLLGVRNGAYTAANRAVYGVKD